MSSSIDRVRTHAAQEVESDHQNAGKAHHSAGDRFAHTEYKGKVIRKRARMERPKNSRSLAKLARRPKRTVTPRPAGAMAKPASPPKQPAPEKSHAWRDPYRQGGGNGRSGNQGDHEADENEATCDDNPFAGKFSVSRKSHGGFTITLSDEVQVYAASVSKLTHRRWLICRHGVQILGRLPEARAFNQAQCESHYLLTPLMAHQIFALRRSRSQWMHALARKEGQVRGASTASSGALQRALLDMLAAGDHVNESNANEPGPGLADIVGFLRESRAPK